MLSCITKTPQSAVLRLLTVIAAIVIWMLLIPTAVVHTDPSPDNSTAPHALLHSLGRRVHFFSFFPN